MKNFSKKIIAFMFAFLFLFSDIGNCFNHLVIEVHAAEPEYTLVSRRNMGAVEIQEVHHGKDTPFRTFRFKDGNTTQRVFCGYSEGRGHEGDEYKRQVVEAKNWKSAPDSAKYGKNVTKIWQAIAWYHTNFIGLDLKDSGNDFYRYVVQTYIWCASSGYNYETALKQLAKGKGWNYTKKVKPVMDQINAFGKKADGKVYRFGQVAIYTKTKCNSSVDNKLEHQPYYRWIPVKYDTQEVSATASDSAEKNVTFNLIKLGQESEPLSGAEFKISTKNVDGSDFSVTKTTDTDGKIHVTLQRKYTETVKVTKKYCANYDKLTDDQKEELSLNKIYATKDAAYAAAKKEATARAKEYAEQSLSDTNYEWTVTETKAPDGYVLPSNTTRTITEFGYETTIEHTRLNSKTDIPDIPDPDPDEPDEPKGDGSIEIWKQASHNEYDPVYSLNGAVYEITKTDGTLTKTVTTYTKDGVEGYACASGLSPGDYTVKEVTAPLGFEKDPTEYSVTIEKGITDQLKTVRSTETPSRGSLKVKKTIQKKSDGSMMLEAGVQFVLKSVNDFKDGSSYEKTITTGDNGIADFSDLPFGMYQLDFSQEYRDRIASENPNITLVNLPISISIIQGSKNKYKGQNLELGIDASDKSMTDVQLDEAAVTVHKTMLTPDREGSMVSEPEKNAEFQLIKKDTNAVFDTLVTDEDGNASSKTIGSDDFGDYILKQTKGSVGYSRLEDKEISITESGELNFEFTGKDVFEGEAIYLDKRKIDCDPDTQKILSDQKIYEAGAKYYVLNLGKLDQAAINALKSKDETWSKEERQAFIQAHATAIASNDYEGKGYFVTDNQGEGSILYPEKFPNGYVLIQTEGEEDHFMSVPLFSENAKESKFSVTKRTKDADGKNLQSNVWNIYAENWPIPYFAVAQFKKVKVKDSCGNTELEKNAKFKILKSDGTYLIHPETGKEIVCQADNDGIIRVPYLVQGVYSLIQVGGSAFHKPLNQDSNLFVILKSHMVYEEEDVENYIAKDMDKISAEKKAKIYGINAQGEVKTFVDQPYLSKLTISKISSISGIPLSDTVFTIEKRVMKDGKEVWEPIGTEKTENGTTVIDPMHFITNDDGEVTVKGLSFGRYRITEIQAKNGYLLSETDTGIDSTDENFVYQTREVVINEDNVETDANGKPVKDSTGLMTYKDTSKKLTFKDSPIFGKIGLNKAGEVITSFDADASEFIYKEAAIDGAEYGLYAAEDILDEKGNVIWSKGTLIDTKVTDVNGNIKFLNPDHTDPNNPDNFPMGSYYIKETKTPQGFEMDNYIHIVVLSWEPKPKNDLLEAAGEVEPPYQTSAGIQQTYFLEGGSKLTDSTGLNTRIKNAKEVIFTYEKAPTGVTKYDVSEIGDGSVVLWQDTSILGRFYVSTQTDDQVIYFNTYCDQMFYRCERLERIVFHNVDTSHMRSADKMFAYCLSLNELDLSSWDTGNLNISTAMFANSPALESIYVGTNAVTPGEEIVVEDGLTVSANHSFAYFDPDASGVTEEEKEIKKFSAEDFTFSMLYTNGSGDDVVVTDDDIESFSPAYPVFNNKSKREGELEVTINFKNTSVYHNAPYSNGSVKVTVNVVDISMDDLVGDIEEHPVANTNVKDAHTDIVIQALKTERGINDSKALLNSIGGAEFTVYAETDLVDITGKVMVRKGEVMKTVTSLSMHDDTGGYTGCELPSDLYAKDQTAEYLYRIVETKAPNGYSLDPDIAERTAYIPNMNLLTNPSDEDVKNKMKGNEHLSVDYEKENNEMIFHFIFKDKQAPTIRKVWEGEGVKRDVPEDERPEYLDVQMYTSSNTLYKTIRLTKENNWTYEFDKDIDLTKYTYQEVKPSGVRWRLDDKDGNRLGGYENPDKNIVIIYNTNPDLDYVGVRVEKVWADNNNEDGLRPSSVKVEILQDGVLMPKYSGTKAITLNSSNNWSQTISASTKDFPAQDEFGNEYEYTFREQTSAGSSNLSFLTGDAKTGYVEIDEDIRYSDSEAETKGYHFCTKITNRHSSKNFTAAVKKVWKDDNDIRRLRPNEICVHLYEGSQKLNNFTVTYKDPNTNVETSRTVTDGNVYLSESNGWQAEVRDMEEADYHWEEDTVENYIIESSEVTREIDNTTSVESSLTTITNVVDVKKGTVEVSKMIPLYNADLDNDLDFTFILTGTDIFGKSVREEKKAIFKESNKSANTVTIDGKQYLKVAVYFQDLEWGDYELREKGQEATYFFDSFFHPSGCTMQTDADGTHYLTFPVGKDRQDFSATFHNEKQKGSLLLKKYRNTLKTEEVKGVEYTIVPLDKNGNVAGNPIVKTTDANGEAFFDNLEQSTYRVTETKTVKGLQLLAESFTVKVPVVLDKNTAERETDVTKAFQNLETQDYYFYDLTYDIVNSPNFQVPRTGGMEKMLCLALVPAGLLLVLYVINRKKKTDQ